MRPEGRIQRFFRRNHQKVKLVDDTQFIGSLNVADAYSGVRFGDSSFRDLNAVVEGYSTLGARNFFREMLLRNVKYHSDQLDEEKIRTQFAEFDRLFPNKESDEFNFIVE